MADWVYVDSSNIEAVCYLEDSRELQVRFINGSTYSYSDVPQEIYEELINAPSKGSYLNRMIKGIYSYQKL
jgi:hypothetical protein